MLDSRNMSECASSFPTFRPPYGILSALTRKKNELLRTLDDTAGTVRETEEMHASYQKVLARLFNDIEEQSQILNDVEKDKMYRWVAVHRDDSVNCFRGQSCF